MLTKRYLSSVKNVPTIFQKIVSGTAPERFTNEHLKNLGFRSSYDSGIIPLLKELGFLTQEGVPTRRYHDYRDPSRSKRVMGEALKEAYSEIFHINSKPTRADKPAIEGLFKSTHNVTDRVSELQSMTFFALLDLAELSDDEPSASVPIPSIGSHDPASIVSTEVSTEKKEVHTGTLSLRYNIEIHLPATKEIEVYNAIFKSLKEHLVD